jgi:hypothetical protein
MKSWRAERNWWISLLALTTWFIVLRVSVIVSRVLDSENNESQKKKEIKTKEMNVAGGVKDKAK